MGPSLPSFFFQVRIAEEEPHRLQVQRSCYTKAVGKSVGNMPLIVGTWVLKLTGINKIMLSKTNFLRFCVRVCSEIF